jgi:hypothetical protein
MDMIDVFAKQYGKKYGETLKAFTRRVRHFGDALAVPTLIKLEIRPMDIKEHLEAKLIKYEPRMGYQGRYKGYSLTAAGIKAVYEKAAKNNMERN